MRTFAAYLAVGPGSSEAARAIDLIESLFHYESSVAHLVVVADGAEDLSALYSVVTNSSCELSILPHPRANSPLNKYGGLCASNLIALDYIRRYSSVDFVLKLDTDSLIIAPFLRRITDFLENKPGAGMIGTLGDSCNRETRSFRMDAAVVRAVRTGVEIGLSKGSMSPAEEDVLRGWGVTTALQLQSFREISALLEPLMKKEFAGAHCQGGAYVITRGLLDGLLTAGLLRKPHLWLDLEIGEDQMMGAFCCIAGLQVLDFSDEREVFGIQARGLAYSPGQLLDRGYGIIHSIKNDVSHGESEIRVFFGCVREQRMR